MRACIIPAASFVLAVDKLFISHFFLSSFQTFSGDTAFYFSDFLLDDVLGRNPLGRLERFVVSNVSLTLISALRLISSRPKLRTVGRLLGWDVQVRTVNQSVSSKTRFDLFFPFEERRAPDLCPDTAEGRRAQAAAGHHHILRVRSDHDRLEKSQPMMMCDNGGRK